MVGTTDAAAGCMDYLNTLGLDVQLLLLTWCSALDTDAVVPPSGMVPLLSADFGGQGS